MSADFFSLAGRGCCLQRTDPQPRQLLLYPAGEHEGDSFLRLFSLLEAEARSPFALATFRVRDWNRELSPWEASPVFGQEDFGRGAPETLAFLEQALLPELRRRLSLPEGAEIILGGYSLAGLFSLWCGCQTGTFDRIAAMSPSVWFPGWIDWARSHPFCMKSAYLSLGDREEKAKNPVLAQVGECIRAQQRLMEAVGIPSKLEWNPGNHFSQPTERCARGFLWCMNSDN